MSKLDAYAEELQEIVADMLESFDAGDATSLQDEMADFQWKSNRYFAETGVVFVDIFSFIFWVSCGVMSKEFFNEVTPVLSLCNVRGF